MSSVPLQFDIMLSYSHRDEEAVLRIKSSLQQRGLVVWFDKDYIRGYLDSTMAKAIDLSGTFVCCLSKNYENSVNAMREFRYASSQNKRIIAIRLEQGKRSPAIEFVVGPSFWLLYENNNETQLEMLVNYIVKEVSRFKTEDKNEYIETAKALKVTELAPTVVPEAENQNSELRTITLNDLDFSENSYCIGSGGFGCVYLVKLDMLETAAFKKLNSGTPSKKAKQEFLKEAKIMARINHPRLVRFYGIVDDFETKTMGIVMEYVSHGSLFDIINDDEQDPLPLESRFQLLLDVAIGMFVLHNQDIIHKDIKTQNILVDENLRAKICDFGLAVIKREITSKIPQSADVLAGTRVYMAPELFEFNSKSSKASDVFAFAVIMSEMMTWSGPFGQDLSELNPDAIYQMVIREQKRPTLEFPEGTPDGFEKFLSDCWDHNPANRPSFSKIRASLFEFTKAIQTDDLLAEEARAAINPLVLTPKPKQVTPLISENFNEQEPEVVVNPITDERKTPLTPPEAPITIIEPEDAETKKGKTTIDPRYDPTQVSIAVDSPSTDMDKTSPTPSDNPTIEPEHESPKLYPKFENVLDTFTLNNRSTFMPPNVVKTPSSSSSRDRGTFNRSFSPDFSDLNLLKSPSMPSSSAVPRTFTSNVHSNFKPTGAEFANASPKSIPFDTFLDDRLQPIGNVNANTSRSHRFSFNPSTPIPVLQVLASEANPSADQLYSSLVPEYHLDEPEDSGKKHFETGYKYYTGIGAAHSIANAMQSFKLGADLKNVACCAYLAECYLSFRPTDLTIISNYAKNAANQKHPLGLAVLGICHKLGVGIEQSWQKAVELFQEAIDVSNKNNDLSEGFACANFYLASSYQFGQGIAKDLQKSAKHHKTRFRWCEDAVEQGNVLAQSDIAYAYENGIGTEKDPRKALYWYRSAAEHDVTEAQHGLGRLYERGSGVVKDSFMSMYYYQLAAEKGYFFSMIKVSQCYEHGIGVSQDLSKAIYWYRKAADLGESEARYKLGQFHENGKCLMQDFDTSVNWYLMAAEQGHVKAQNNLGSCYQYGKGVAVDFVRAIYWYRKAAEKGDADAQCNLGICYSEGIGVQMDEDEALTLFAQSASQDNFWGQCQLESRNPHSERVKATALYQFQSNAYDTRKLSFEKGEELEVFTFKEYKGWYLARKISADGAKLGIVQKKFIKFPEKPPSLHVKVDDVDAKVIVVARALFDYTADPKDPSEVTFLQGDIFEIINRDTKWWQTKSGGIVPSNYFEVISQTTPSPTSSTKPSPSNSPKIVENAGPTKTRNVFNNIFGKKK
ncbi:hypothetical protein HK098_003675 [Nowakowskiella sp. JEL0407]|nr:hypothetical protein HK098_003675 [Nowakowskiella sp. JEL0407]